MIFKTFKDILDDKKNTIFPFLLSIEVFFAVDNVISRVIYKQQNPLILLILLTDSEWLPYKISMRNWEEDLKKKLMADFATEK